MDEVDGMSGGDRGGNSVLIETIKMSKTPIICVCNDRQNQKIRTLANHCLDIKFQRPQKNQIAKRLAEIATKEGMKFDMKAFDLLSETFGQDIRQILNFMQLSLVGAKKDETVMITNFDAASKLLNRPELNKIALHQKFDLFFIDYDLIPLLIQENYLSSYRPSKEKQMDDLQIYTEAADMISTGDILNKAIRVGGEWSPMPNYGFLSSIYPCELVSTSIPFPKFPDTKKIIRETKELRIALAPAITGARNAVKNEYSSALLELMLYNLKDGTKESIETFVKVMEEYDLNPDMLKEHLVDIQFRGNKRDPYAGISTQTKTAVTKLYSKRHKSSLKKKVTEKSRGNEEEITSDLQIDAPNKIVEKDEENYESDVQEDESEDYQVEVKIIKDNSKIPLGAAKNKSETKRKGSKKKNP